MKNNLDMSLLGIGNQVPCFFTIFHSLHGSKLILSELKNEVEQKVIVPKFIILTIDYL